MLYDARSYAFDCGVNRQVYYCCGITDKGIAESNEDSYLVGGHVMNEATKECDVIPPFIAAVADGVGGEDAGEVASRLTLQLLSSGRPYKGADITARIMGIHRNVRDLGIKSGHSNMQSTLCALCVDEKNNAYVINVGDSRLYLYREGTLRQISTDQSLVQMLYEQGSITEIEKAKHNGHNIIMPVIGNLANDPEPVITQIDGGLGYGDVVLICSDGLSDYVTRGEIEEILSWPMHLSKRLRALADLALEHGSTDNITAVGVFCRK